MNVKSLAASYREADNKYQSLYRALTKAVDSHINRREAKVKEAGEKARAEFEAGALSNTNSINHLRDQLETVRDIRIKLKKELTEALTNDLSIVVKVD